MKKHLLILTTLFLSLVISYGQAQIIYQKTYGIGAGQSVQQTNDRGFIILGYAIGSPTIISLIKTDSLGVRQWSRSYSSGTDALNAYSIQQTNDGGYIITGNIIYSSVSNEDIILLKTDSGGTLQWKKYFSFTGTEYGFSVQQTNDGGYILTGYSYSDIVLIKTASDGSMQWSKTIGGAVSQQGKCVRQTNDGGFIIAGFTTIAGADIYLVKTDSIGLLQWTKTIGGTNSDYGTAIEQTSDGGFIITGKTNSYGAGNYDAYLVKTDSLGTLQWTKTFGGINDEEANSVQQTNDGGFIITGKTNSYGAGDYDIYLLKTNSLGTLQWTKTFGGTNVEVGYSVVQTIDGGFVINGYTTSSFATYSSDIYLVKTDSNGNSGCNETSPTSIESTGGVEGSGGTEGTGGTTGNQFVQTNFGSLENSICTTVGVYEVTKGDRISIFPNPFSFITTLHTDKMLKDATLTLYNSYGQVIKEIKNINGQTITLNRDNLSSGFYFLRLSQEDIFFTTDKLVITDN